ncbi:MAG: TIGR03936 family radical SAM-associated protein [Actinomycetota bacterium]|nr:TIGR03936 family radical SAM-associated protein [Actinomycetota bacterium]
MAKRIPEGPPPPPTVQRLRIRYAKRGRLRFTSHRDFARAFERALRRAGVPMAYSAGFSPHPKISYLGAAPTGVASEAEYLEIGVSARVDPGELAAALDASLPGGLDILEVVESAGGSLAERIEASRWEVRLPGVAYADAAAAVAAFLAESSVEVERLTKDGRRLLDARTAVVSAAVEGAAPGAASSSVGPACAILTLVVRHVTPAVRPDDVLVGLRRVADLVPPEPFQATRSAQGPLGPDGRIADPLALDRAAAATADAGSDPQARTAGVAGCP